MLTKQRLKRSLIRTLNSSGIPALLPAGLAGIGFILLLHRVRPDPGHDFVAHGSLEITPEFLVQLIERMRVLEIDVVDLDEAARRLETGEPGRRFACITLDDGYRDNYEYARPIFERYEVPYSIFLTTGLPDNHAIFWWLTLEEVIRTNDSIAIRIDGQTEHHETSTLVSKCETYRRLHKYFRDLPASACADAAKQLCDDFKLDPAAFCAEQGMNWDMIREITNSRFGRIEAHTRDHMALSRQTLDDARLDIEGGVDRIFAETSSKPRHFAYPFGDAKSAGPRDVDLVKDLAFVSAVTTSEGVLHRRHQSAMHALPRLEVNGHYQSDDYLGLLLRGFAPLLTIAS